MTGNSISSGNYLIGGIISAIISIISLPIMVFSILGKLSSGEMAIFAFSLNSYLYFFSILLTISALISSIYYYKIIKIKMLNGKIFELIGIIVGSITIIIAILYFIFTLLW